MRWNRPKNIIVTGGKGYIGSTLVERLSVTSDRVISIDKKNGPLDDLTSDNWQSIDSDILVHLACEFGESGDASTENFKITNAVQMYMIKHPHTSVIYVSSAAVYPDLYKSMKEDDAVQANIPTNYGRSKFYGEQALSRVRKITVLRLSNVYEGGNGVIETFKNGGNTIHGDGFQVRDFVPLEIVLNTIAITVLNPRAYQGIYNVSAGVGHTINDIFKEHGTGDAVHVDEDTGVRFSVLDNTKWKAKWR